MQKDSRTGLAIIGATGLVGKAIYRILDRERYRISVVGRSVDKLKSAFPEAEAHLTWADFESSNATSYDAIVNMAGSNVSDTRWTAAYKQVMIDSRINATQMCVRKCAKNPQIHLVNASAVSAYGFYTEQGLLFTEDDRDKRNGPAFLQDLIDKWEVAALEAE